SGFWSKDTISLCERLGVRYVMAIRSNTPSVARAIANIEEDRFVPIGYVEGGEAEVAECTYGGQHLVVRRTRLTGAQAQLFPDWRHFAFLTDVEGDPVTLDAFYRQHAVVELAIKDLKEGAGMEHVPSGNFSANGAWLACAVLAHNLVRWTAILGSLTPVGELVV
ncbi:transposase IS4 family protein, partial [mine drainage metagenome]